MAGAFLAVAVPALACSSPLRQPSGRQAARLPAPSGLRGSWFLICHLRLTGVSTKYALGVNLCVRLLLSYI